MGKKILLVDDSTSMRQVAGAKVWITKPFKPAQLLGVLEKLVG